MINPPNRTDAIVCRIRAAVAHYQANQAYWTDRPDEPYQCPECMAWNGAHAPTCSRAKR